MCVYGINIVEWSERVLNCVGYINTYTYRKLNIVNTSFPSWSNDINQEKISLNQSTRCLGKGSCRPGEKTPGSWRSAAYFLDHSIDDR